MIDRKYVGFDGYEKIRGRIRELTEDRLAPDHHEFVNVCDHTRRADYVLQFRTGHR